MKKVLVAIIFVLGVTAANAYVLDWTGVDYAAGAINQQFTNVDGSGVTMDFQWVDNGGPGGLANLYSGLPDDDALTTTYPGAAPGLWYATNNGGDISVVITFSEAVSNVFFNIYDIDGLTANMEKVRIKAFDNSNTPVNIGSYLVSYGDGINVAFGDANFGVEFSNLAGVDLNPGQAGWEKNQAMIGIDSGAQIKKIGIAFTNLDGVRGEIIENISFVPEPATMLLLGLGAVMLRKKK